MIGTGRWQAERSHILERLAEQAIKFLVAGANLDDVFQPIRQRLGVARLVAVPDAVIRRCKMPVAVRQCIAKTAMPSSGLRATSKLSRPLAYTPLPEHCAGEIVTARVKSPFR
jgi:hypothetical protein